MAQFDDGRALAAFVVGRLGDGDDVRVLAQEVSEGAAEHAHADAVDDADAREAGEEGALDEALDFGLGFVGGAADDVDLRAEGVVVAVTGGEGDAAATADALGRGLADGCDFGDVGARNAGLYGAEADLE